MFEKATTGHRARGASGQRLRPGMVESRATRAEHKHLTVLFADISGSTALSRSIELDTWWSVLADVIELMGEAVHRFGGWVGNFTGDGVQGVFETPGGREHARRACNAALCVRESLQTHATQCEHARRFDVDVHMGINSGEVLTGTIGQRHSRHYTACGYTVALAKRMETLAKPGGIYVSEHTAALLGDELELCDLGFFDVKGASCPVGVFELVGPTTTSDQKMHASGLTRKLQRQPLVATARTLEAAPGLR